MKFFSFLPKKLRFCLFLAIAASFSLSPAVPSLNTAWKDLVAVAQEYTNRGIPLHDVMEEALVFGSSEVLTEKTATLFVTLLENIFVMMRKRANFETSRGLRDVHQHMSAHILPNQYARQRIALAVFRNYKKWNVIFAPSGDVDRCDIVVFASFLNSLNKDFFNGLLDGETPEIARDTFIALRTHIDRLVKVVNPGGLTVLARSGTNRAQYSLRSGMKEFSKKSRSAKDAVGRQLQRISFKNVFYTVGAGSAVAAFLMGSYAFIYRKKVLREFGLEVLKIGGGAKEVAKEATLLYTLPETRWDRIASRVKDWVYNDPEIRKGRAVKLRNELLLDSAKYMQAISPEHDELTDLLLFAASNPQSVKPGMAARVKDEWTQDLRRRDFMLRQKKAERTEQTQEAKSFTQAAMQYLRVFGRKPVARPPAGAQASAKKTSNPVMKASRVMSSASVFASNLVARMRRFSHCWAPAPCAYGLLPASIVPSAPFMEYADQHSDSAADDLKAPLLKKSRRHIVRYFWCVSAGGVKRAERLLKGNHLA